MKDFLIGAAIAYVLVCVFALLEQSAPADVDPVDMPVYRDYR